MPVTFPRRFKHFSLSTTDHLVYSILRSSAANTKISIRVPKSVDYFVKLFNVMHHRQIPRKWSQNYKHRSFSILQVGGQSPAVFCDELMVFVYSLQSTCIMTCSACFDMAYGFPTFLWQRAAPIIVGWFTGHK